MDNDVAEMPFDDEPVTTNPDLTITSSGLHDQSIELSQPVTAQETGRVWWRRINIGKVVIFIASLYLFVLAITLMKDGARGLAPLLGDKLSISNMANSMGFGWLFSYLIMSGSPVAASALTFFDTGIIDDLSTFAMITGSRLGASFIVLFIGFLYVLRGRDRATSLSMGLLSLIVTSSTYVPGFFVGVFILQSGWIDSWQLQSGAVLHTFIDRAINPISIFASIIFPDWSVFLLGLGIILLSFKLFDKCLPQMALKESQVGMVSRLVYHPMVMFMLGASITMISMSVSLSLSILVPLSQRGFVRRENVIPYIMGANITTFTDTLFAAALLDNPLAFTIVLAEMFSIAVVSIIVLSTIRVPYQRTLLNIVGWVTSSNRNMVVFMVIIFVIPLILFFLD